MAEKTADTVDEAIEQVAEQTEQGMTDWNFVSPTLKVQRPLLLESPPKV
jgi:hypothetical protein